MTITATGHSYIDVESGTRLEAWYPVDGVDPARSCLAEKVGLIRGEVVTTTIASLDDPVADVADAYLRLHLLSRREVQPNTINLDGIFGFLTNVAWTTAGPVLPEQVDELRSRAAAEGRHVQVTGLDKFPRMTDYVIRGGASIMGTLSGGGKERITVGENCLIGANGGIGISLGDNCTVAAGVYITAGTKVLLPDGKIVAARQLSGRDDMLFLQNSVTGAVELRVSNPERWGGINEDLHSN